LCSEFTLSESDVCLFVASDYGDGIRVGHDFGRRDFSILMQEDGLMDLSSLSHGKVPAMDCDMGQVACAGCRTVGYWLSLGGVLLSCLRGLQKNWSGWQ